MQVVHRLPATINPNAKAALLFLLSRISIHTNTFDFSLYNSYSFPPRMWSPQHIHTLQLARTNTLNPTSLAPHRRQILVPIRCDNYHIFNSYSTNGFILLQHVEVDVLGIKNRLKKMRVEVDPRFDSLYYQCGVIKSEPTLAFARG